MSGEIEVRVEGHAFVIGADDIARVSDIEAGKWLGFAQPINVRKLIRAGLKAGSIKDSEVLSGAEKTSRAGGRPGTSFSLTRAGVIKVAMRSDLPKAHALVDDVIRVYEEVQRLRSAPQALAQGGVVGGGIGDNAEMARGARILIRLCGLATGVDDRRVRGWLQSKRGSGVTSFLRIDQRVGKFYLDMLESISKGLLPPPWRTPKRLPESRNLPLPGIQ